MTARTEENRPATRLPAHDRDVFRRQVPSMGEVRNPDGNDEDSGAEERSEGRDYPGRILLKAGSPKIVLDRLLDGDPFELNARCVDRLETQAILMSPERLFLRVIARVAYAAPRYDGTPPLDIWIADRIGVSLRELLDEDIYGERVDIVPGPEDDARASYVAGALGMERYFARRACVAFNAQSHLIRRAFFGIVLHNKTVNEYASEENATTEEARSLLTKAFRVLGLTSERWGHYLDDGGTDGSQ